MRPFVDLLYRIRKTLLRVFRAHTTGVKVMLFGRGGDILLIRNSYGRSDQFALPGGGVRPFEKPARAAAREVREELGCAVADLAYVSTHVNRAEGRRDTVHLFRGRIDERPVPDGFEVEEARFFALDALPEAMSPGTLRRIEEHLGRRPTDGGW